MLTTCSSSLPIYIKSVFQWCNIKSKFTVLKQINCPKQIKEVFSYHVAQPKKSQPNNLCGVCYFRYLICSTRHGATFYWLFCKYSHAKTSMMDWSFWSVTGVKLAALLKLNRTSSIEFPWEFQKIFQNNFSAEQTLPAAFLMIKYIKKQHLRRKSFYKTM